MAPPRGAPAAAPRSAPGRPGGAGPHRIRVIIEGADRQTRTRQHRRCYCFVFFVFCCWLLFLPRRGLPACLLLLLYDCHCPAAVLRLTAYFSAPSSMSCTAIARRRAGGARGSAAPSIRAHTHARASCPSQSGRAWPSSHRLQAGAVDDGPPRHAAFGGCCEKNMLPRRRQRTRTRGRRR